MTRASRQLGYFRLSIGAVKARDYTVTRILGACAVYRAETKLELGDVEYWASSRYFREVPEGERIPAYIWYMTPDDLKVQEVSS